MKFQTSSLDHMMLPILHAMFAMVHVLPHTEMQGNSKEGFIKTNKYGNLKNEIRVQMTQVDGIIIKEAAKEGRNR